MTIGTAPQRLEWLDRARGLGILLVVVGHALGGIIDSPLGKDADGARLAFFAIYTFHMPLFFLLSGLLVADRLERNEKRFTLGLLTDLVWPYFLWSTLQFATVYAIGELANRPVDGFWRVIVRLPYEPISQFWFLYALLVLHLLALLLLKRVGRTMFLGIAVAVKIVAALVAAPTVVRLAALHGGWYALGVFLGPEKIDALSARLRRPPAIALLAVAAGAAIGATYAITPLTFPKIAFETATSPQIAGMAWQLAAMPAAMLGMSATVLLAYEVRGAVARLLEFLGRRSMPIFILHIMAIASTRILLARGLGMTELALILPAIVAAGIAMPLIAFAVLARLGATKALGLGRP